MYKTDTKKEAKRIRQQLLQMYNWKSDDYMGSKSEKFQCCYRNIGNINNLINKLTIILYFGYTNIFSADCQ